MLTRSFCSSTCFALSAPRMDNVFMKNAYKSKFFYMGLVVLAVLVFFVQNNRPVEIDFFFWTLASFNLLVLLALFFALGAAAGWFGNKLYRLKKSSKKEDLRLKKAAREAARRDYPRGHGTPVQ